MKLFVDTGAWFALNSRTDENHRRAVTFLRQFRHKPVLLHTTDYIVDETLTLLRFKVSHRQAVKFLNFLSKSSTLRRETVGADILREAETILRKYKDKRWSFTDCVSFAHMDDQHLEDAFTFDFSFVQYGKRIHPC